MNVKELKRILENSPEDMEILVVYPGRDKDSSVLDSVSGWNYNGNAIQLESEEWVEKMKKKGVR